MEDHSLEPDEERRVQELADRAQTLLDRRKMLTKSGKALALPLLVSLCVTREAMGMSGSGGGGGGDAPPVDVPNYDSGTGGGMGPGSGP